LRHAPFPRRMQPGMQCGSFRLPDALDSRANDARFDASHGVALRQFAGVGVAAGDL